MDKLVFTPHPKISERHARMFMSQAFTIAETSYAKDLKVGALLVKPLDDGTHRMISDGYNGTEPGEDNCCEEADGSPKPGVIHAERNVFRKLLKSNENSVGGVLFVTRSPCKGCVEYIIDSGVTHVYFCERHREDGPMLRLLSKKIKLGYVDKACMRDRFLSIANRINQEKFNDADYVP